MTPVGFYAADKKPHVRENTWTNKTNIIEKYSCLTPKRPDE